MARKKRLMLRFIYATMPFHTGIGVYLIRFQSGSLANIFGVVHQYVQQAHKRLLGKEWIKRLSGKYKISKFELKHHLCDDESVPLDRDGRPSIVCDATWVWWFV